MLSSYKNFYVLESAKLTYFFGIENLFYGIIEYAISAKFSKLVFLWVIRISMDQKGSKIRQLLTFVVKIVLVITSFIILGSIDNIGEKKYLLHPIVGLNYFLVPSIVFSITRLTIISFYNARHANRTVRGNFVLGINRLTAVLNFIFVVIAIMIAFGIKPIEFLTSLTIVAMAIAVILRDYITNMISGLFIMFSEQLSVGDRIKVGDHKGRIVDITFAHIELQNEEDDIVMIPNNLVFTNSMVNLSAHRSNLFTVRFELPIAMATNLLDLENEIRSLLINHPNLDPNSSIDLNINEVGKDYVRYKIELHATSSSNYLHKQIENEILKQILLMETLRTKAS